MAKFKKPKGKPTTIPVRGAIQKPKNRSGYRTRSATAPDRRAEALIRELAAQRVAQALQAQREEALRNQPQAPAGNRGDGNLHIAFIQMGQGDCAIMSTPKGRTIMFDCGSDATEMDDDDVYTRFVHDTIYGPKFLGGTNKLDYLILTHPDSDHYNRLKRVLNGDTEIYNIYHSSFLTSYSVNQVSSWIKSHTNKKFIKAVVLSEGLFSPSINLSTVQPMADGKVIDRLDANGAIRILQEDNCIISILCSNVSTDTQKDNSNDTNRGSLVSIISAFGKKILICGDATRSTEDFLITKYGNNLTNLDVVQAPHHGSNVTSSDPKFVNKVKPQMVLASAGKNVVKDHLPSKITLDRYASVMADNIVPNHELFYWTPGALGSYNHESSFTKKNIWVTGSNSTKTLFLNQAGFQVV